MDKAELLNSLRMAEGCDFPIHVFPEDSSNINIEELPQNIELEICDINKNNVHLVELEGTIGWRDDKICIFMSHDWYRKWWDMPLGMAHHMDMMKRLIEFRKNEKNDISEIQMEDEGDWCHLNYTIIPENVKTIKDVYDYGLSISRWVDEKLFITQNKISKVINEMATEISTLKMVEIPELIRRIDKVQDNNEKGRILEELMCKIFSCVKGFEIIQRVITATEEIDIVILNKSIEPLWVKESNLILVECKNWSTKCGKNEIVVFKEKLLNRRNRAKIGFFVSWNGFTSKYSKEELRSSQSDILIIPITKDNIYEILLENNVSKLIEKWWINGINT